MVISHADTQSGDMYQVAVPAVFLFLDLNKYQGFQASNALLQKSTDLKHELSRI